MKAMIKQWLKKALWIGVLGGASAVLVLSMATSMALREIPQNLSALTQASVKPQLLDRNGNPLTITYQNRWNAHNVLPLHRIPSFLQQAFILAEDKRFYQHSGMDWRARFNALWQNVVALRGVRGASTISEQVIRMIHLRPRSLWARWLEGWEARELERHFDKATILEFYLNQVPYAAQRRGVQQAATYYFDRDLNTLSEKEMLALAVLVRAPSRFDLYKSTERIEGRLSVLLKRSEKQGLVSDKVAVAAQSLKVNKPKPMLDVSHFANHIYRQAKPGKHKIHTTLDSGMQHFAQLVLNERLKKLKSKRVSNAGMIVIDHQTDEVLVWAVSSGQDKEAAAYDTLLVKRQPGSTLKPFVYALALEKGWTAATLIDDSPLKEGVGRGVHAYRNYSNTYYGDISVRKALGNSLNIPAIKAAQYVGVDPLLATLTRLGINDLNLRSVDYGHGIALGNAEISLYSLANAYAAIARGGVYRLLKKTDLAPVARSARVFSPEVSSLIGNILSDADARAQEFGRGSPLHLPIQTAVKTGTSNDYRDAWVMAYNHRYVVGVWMGNLNNEPMDNITGSNGPALAMRAMFSELNRHSETKPLFISRKLVRYDICTETGLIDNGQCTTAKEWFLATNQPSMNPSVVDNVSYAIAQPVDQMLVARDPRIADGSEALEFKLNHDEGVHKVDWFVNDQLIASTPKTSYYWPLQAGEFSVSAKVYQQRKSEVVETQRVSYEVK